MATSKQAKKRIRTSEKSGIENKGVRTSMRSALKSVLGAETQEAAKALVPHAMKKVDKAAKKGVIHANSAARKKSQIARAVAAKK